MDIVPACTVLTLNSEGVLLSLQYKQTSHGPWTWFQKEVVLCQQPEITAWSVGAGCCTSVHCGGWSGVDPPWGTPYPYVGVILQHSRSTGEQHSFWFPNPILPFESFLRSRCHQARPPFWVAAVSTDFDTTIPVSVIFQGIKGKWTLLTVPHDWSF